MGAEGGFGDGVVVGNSAGGREEGCDGGAGGFGGECGGVHEDRGGCYCHGRGRGWFWCWWW